MKKLCVLALVLVVFLTGCGGDKPSGKELTCADDPKGRPKKEQTAIADACFRGGSFKKSPHKEW